MLLTLATTIFVGLLVGCASNVVSDAQLRDNTAALFRSANMGFDLRAIVILNRRTVGLTTYYTVGLRPGVDDSSEAQPTCEHSRPDPANPAADRPVVSNRYLAGTGFDIVGWADQENERRIFGSGRGIGSYTCSVRAASR